MRLTTAHGIIEVPAVPYPGIHPGVVAMPIGQGHTLYGRNAEARGSNPLAILDPTADAATGALAYGATTVTLTKVADAKSATELTARLWCWRRTGPAGRSRKPSRT